MVSPTDEENKDLDQQETEDSSPSTSDNEEIEDSSGPEKSETSDDEPSTFEVVKDAIDPDRKDEDGEEKDEDDDSSEDDDSEEDEGDSEEKSEDKPEDEADESDEPSLEELKRWKPKTRKRFENLQAKYREEKSLREAAEVDAGRYRNFVEFLDTNRISQDEANELFDIGALLKNDPVKALEAITPHYQRLLHITGNILPPDLEQQVAQGLITKQNAMELSRLRMAGQTNQAIQEDKQQHQQQQDARQQAENHENITNAIAQWEQGWSSSDPDYSAKKDRVLERVELMLARAAREQNLPQTTEQAIELANKAKTDVEAELRQYKPKKRVRTVDGGSSSSTQPEPKDTKDVIRRTLSG